MSENQAEFETKLLARIREIEALYEALAPFKTSGTLDELLEQAIELLIRASGADAALIGLKELESGRIYCPMARGFDERYLDSTRKLTTGSPAVEFVFTHGQPIFSPDIGADNRIADKRQVEFGYLSCAYLPLTQPESVRGVVHLASRTPGYFGPEKQAYLTAMVRHVSISIENCELLHRATELENSNKIKDEFLCVISHELKTPLTAVMGYAMLLEEEVLGKNTPEQARAARVMRKNCDDLLALIRSILETTKLEAGVSALDREPVDISEMLEELERSYKVFRDHGLEIRWEYPRGLPTILTDRSKLTHILQNLINNALKFTQKGRVRIAAFHNIEAGVMRFEVEDTGVGIDAEKLPLIFEKFRRVDSSNKRIFEGAGLGLFLVKGFAELLGGKISVESEVGRGSTFRVTVPCHDAVSLLCEVADHDRSDH
jgi:signal transduction histidine kinase